MRGYSLQRARSLKAMRRFPLRLAPFWVTLRTTRGAQFDDLARKYYDVAKVADLGRQIGPFRGGQSMGFGG